MTHDGGSSGAHTLEPRKQTIVVVDDSDLVLESTRETLELAGYRVLTRNRPAGCVAMILQEKPDLVLLDVCMPTVSGDTLVKLFAKASPGSKTIILLYSALDEPLLRSKARAAGANGYVVKTNDNAAFVRAVKRWLPHPLGNVQLTSKSAQSSDKYRPVAASSPRLRATEAVSLPVLAPNDVSGERPRTSGSFAIGSATVLFVDHDMSVLSGYRRQLLGQQFEFEFAISGAQALRRLASATPPNVVVSDLDMPKPDGANVLKSALDQDQEWGRRFIVISPHSELETRQKLDPRFTGWVLRKPADPDELLAAIRHCLPAQNALSPARSDKAAGNGS